MRPKFTPITIERESSPSPLLTAIEKESSQEKEDTSNLKAL